MVHGSGPSDIVMGCRYYSSWSYKAIGRIPEVSAFSTLLFVKTLFMAVGYKNEIVDMAMANNHASVL